MEERQAGGTAVVPVPHPCIATNRVFLASFLQDADNLTLSEPGLPHGNSFHGARKSNILWSRYPEKRTLPVELFGHARAFDRSEQLAETGKTSPVSVSAHALVGALPDLTREQSVNLSIREGHFLILLKCGLCFLVSPIGRAWRSRVDAVQVLNQRVSAGCNPFERLLSDTKICDEREVFLTDEP